MATEQIPRKRLDRLVALGGVLLLIGSVVHVLRSITVVVGGSDTLVLVVLCCLIVATLASRWLEPASATLFTLAIGVTGGGYYLSAADVSLGEVASGFDTLLTDSVTLLSGYSVLRMVEAGTWALGFAPAPVFLAWYLGLRRQYAGSVLVGGAGLSFLTLTGDATTGTVLVGVVGATIAVGVGSIDRLEAPQGQWDWIAIAIAAGLLAALFVPVVPGGATNPLAFDETPEGLETVVGGVGERAPIGGSVTLDPEVRFVVEGDTASYWRTGVYDRFTGEAWVMTGNSAGQSLPEPPGESTTETYEITPDVAMQTLPVPPQPVSIQSDTELRVDSLGQPRPTDGIDAGAAYWVRSSPVRPGAAALQRAGTDYPAAVERRYLQLPEDVSAAFIERTATITADTGTPYETATAIERHLSSEKGYSLDVERPSGNVANAFLLEMEAGYCVYFATTMVQMLRAEGIPARYAVGYSTGQSVEGGWVVRGLDAHAWVEAYFPSHGWVLFDPTPALERSAVHAAELESAREAGTPAVDVNESEGEPIEMPDNATNGSVTNENGTVTDTPPETEGPVTLPSIREVLTPGGIGLALVFAIALGASARRIGLAKWIRAEVRIRHQRRTGDPVTDVERAWERLELGLARNHRPRRPPETIREYLETVPDREFETLIDHVERARYGSDISTTEAATVIDRVDEVVRS